MMGYFSYLLVSSALDSEISSTLFIWSKIGPSGAKIHESGCAMLKFAAGPKMDPKNKKKAYFMAFLTPTSYIWSYTCSV